MELLADMAPDTPDIPAIITRTVGALRGVPGVVALVLGGSRATGTHTPASDIDIGIYYDADRFAIAALRQAVMTLDDAHRPDAVTEIGGWGAWVNGGGWLTIDRHPVDLLYRDMERMRQSVAEARAGQFTLHYHWGHPHGLPNTIYAAEVAQCRTLWDPGEVLTDLKAQLIPYPPQLRHQIIENQLGEAEFFIMVARHALPRQDVSYITGCAFRVVACLMHALFAANERWLLNEKGAVASAARLPRTLPHLSKQVAAVYATIGTGMLEQGIEMLEQLAAAAKIVFE